MKSIDIGTAFLVKGELDVATEEPEFTVERNCFLQAASSDDTEDTLKENGWAYAKHEDKFYILGEDAIKIKNLLTIGGKEKDSNIIMTKVGDLRRPMKNGILNTGGEKLSVAIIQKLIANLLGPPSHPGEVLCFCSPGDPADKSLSVVFHRTMLTNFLKSLGYTVECIPEALAIIFSQRPVADDPNEENGQAPFSGIGFSLGGGMANCCFGYKKMPLINFSVTNCIPPGNKVITTNGLINIENINTDDLVLNRTGRWSHVNNTNSKMFNGDIYKFKASGQGEWSTTGDHRLWIKSEKTNFEWEWVEAKDVNIDDKVMQPWIDTHETKHTIGWTRENTNEYMNETMQSKQYYFLGRFLGDGSVFKDKNSDRGIQIALNANSPIKQKFLQSTMESTFGREVSVVLCEKNNVILLKLHDSGLAKWFRKNCYVQSRSGEWMDKIFPWDIAHLQENHLRFFIAGLLDSDGYVDEQKNTIYLGITSPCLAQSFYLALMKIGLKPTVSWRTREGSHDYMGKTIKHIRQIFEVTASGARCKEFIGWLRSENLTIFFDRSEIQGCNVAKITSIQKEQYSGMVYDISVDDKSNSFCLPGCVVHNCGDWIDEEAAKVAGIDVAAMTRFKESKLDLNNIDFADMRQAGLSIFYENMIQNALNKFSEQFNKLDSQIDVPLEIVVAGGTSMVPGFLDKFKKVAEELVLPFKIKNIRLADNPFYAVSHGCLVKAMAIDNKIKAASGDNTKLPENIQDSTPKRAKLK